MTRALLDKALQELDAQIVQLGSLVDTALAQALEALEVGDQDKAGAVVVSDTPIDDLHVAIEKLTFPGFGPATAARRARFAPPHLARADSDRS